MVYVNLPPNLQQLFQNITDRLKKLENGQRFTAPTVPILETSPTVTGLDATDPQSPRIGDIWLNTFLNQVRYVDAGGAAQTFSSGTASGTVTSVGSGTGLTGGPITTAGSLSIANTGVTAASYGSASSVATFTVNAQGQLTVASNTSIAIAQSAVTNLVTDLAAKAPSASPTFTGTVTTPLTTAGYVTTTAGGVLGSVATIPNAGLTNSSVTVNGTTIALGGSGTITAAPSGSAGGDLTGTYPNPTIKASVGLSSPLLTRDNTASEGGQINFARASDGAAYWYIDSYGSTSTPDLRFISGTNNYFQFNANGSFSVNGSTGSSGQVLQSQGSGASPQWATVSGASSNSFTTMAVPSGTNPVASSSTDTLTFANGTGISISGNSTTKTITTALANTAVTAASYGSASQVATFTVDAQGRLTAAANTNIIPPTRARYEATKVSTNQSFTDGTAATVTFPTSTVENVGTFTYSAGNITVPFTGRYGITANVTWANNSTGRRLVRIRKTVSGVTSTLWEQRSPVDSQAGTFSQMITAASERLNANDVVFIEAVQGSGGNLNMTDARITIDYWGT